MQFHSSGRVESLGKFVGFSLSYLIFTAVLFLILSLSGKLAAGSPFLKSMAITGIITLIGYSIRRLLQ